MGEQGSWDRWLSDFLHDHVVGVFVWFFVAIAIALVASARGRSLPGWFAISLFISPVIAAILVMFVLPPIRDND